MLDRVAAQAVHRLLAWRAGRVALQSAGATSQGASHGGPEVWPESWSILFSGLLLGTLAWVAFATRIASPEQLPAEVLFGFLALYFYSAGFLSGRRTGQTGKGA